MSNPTYREQQRQWYKEARVERAQRKARMERWAKRYLDVEEAGWFYTDVENFAKEAGIEPEWLQDLVAAERKRRNA